MKIEIDADELVSLKNKLRDYDLRCRQAESSLEQFDEVKIQKDIKREAFKLFESYIQITFKKLGFKESTRIIDWDCDFWRQVGDGDWAKMQDLEINLGANVEGKFKSAFLRLGIKTK